MPFTTFLLAFRILYYIKETNEIWQHECFTPFRFWLQNLIKFNEYKPKYFHFGSIIVMKFNL